METLWLAPQKKKKWKYCKHLIEYIQDANLTVTIYFKGIRNETINFHVVSVLLQA